VADIAEPPHLRRDALFSSGVAAGDLTSGCGAARMRPRFALSS